MPFDDQMRVRVGSLFGMADFYSSNLRSLGHEAWDLFANNEFMQKAWAREHGMAQRHADPSTVLQRIENIVDRTPSVRLRSFLRPMVDHFAGRPRWFYDILSAQIKYYKPDVLLNSNLGAIPSVFLRKMKPFVNLLLGQYSSAIPEGADLRCYDLMVSPLPDVVASLRRSGIPAEELRLGFEPRVLSHLKGSMATLPVSFVGSLTEAHMERLQLLEYLCARVTVDLWGQISVTLPADSMIRRCYKGQAWGVEMYRILSESKITLNQHGHVSGPYATNMRLFEATGVGTLLVTDSRLNLEKIFEPGKEVVVYGNAEQCLEYVRYYLQHEKEREAIARAGQQRTLGGHTYYQRMKELLAILERHSSV